MEDLFRSRLSLFALLVGPLAIDGCSVNTQPFAAQDGSGGASYTKAEVDQMVAELQGRLAGTAACPIGYSQDANAAPLVICRKPIAGGAMDELIKVGTGVSAFWIDRYEASVWQNADGSGIQYGATNPNGVLVTKYPPSFPTNGQRTPTFVDLYAVSKMGVQPSASLTWFQAQQACRASGKRLPTDEEWLAAASGTNDPGASIGTGGACITNLNGPRMTGGGTTCVSAWGTQDMIGNVWEWTAQWYAGAGSGTAKVNNPVTNWPSNYNGDGTSNVQAWTDVASNTPNTGVPAAALRGGAWADGAQAGVFALDLSAAPSYGGALSLGFRCVSRG